jgi:hypothetical protein
MSSPLTNFQETCADQLPSGIPAGVDTFCSAWLASKAEDSLLFVPSSQSATGDCKFHKLRLSFFSHCAKLIFILSAGNIAAFSALGFDLQV